MTREEKRLYTLIALRRAANAIEGPERGRVTVAVKHGKMGLESVVGLIGSPWKTTSCIESVADDLISEPEYCLDFLFNVLDMLEEADDMLGEGGDL